MSSVDTDDCCPMSVVVGILEVQGAFLEHQLALQKAKSRLPKLINLRTVGIRRSEDLSGSLDGLIIPGGESTTISLYLKRNNMEESLRDWVHDDRHVTWGTCAGMIMLSKLVENQKNGGQHTLGIMDTDVSRNFFGRQVNSFEAAVKIVDLDLQRLMPSTTYPGVFIRAPAVLKTLSDSVKVLATLERPQVGDVVIVATQQDHVIATAFHPELTDDCSWHLYFLREIMDRKK